MNYLEAKELLRDASGLTGKSLEPRLVASAGELRLFDSSTNGKLPDGDSLGDQILRALLVVRRHLGDSKTMERDLAGILVELSLPLRTLASDRRYANTRIPQLTLALDFVLHGFDRFDHGTPKNI